MIEYSPQYSTGINHLKTLMFTCHQREVERTPDWRHLGQLQMHLDPNEWQITGTIIYGVTISISLSRNIFGNFRNCQRHWLV